MNNASSISVYNASAGSGKTYSLVKAYISCLLTSTFYNKHRHLLAITFTNKAVAEMKVRVLDALLEFSKVGDKNEGAKPIMLVEIAKETGIDISILSKKSKSILNSILHNYGAFDIVTIDTLTHRIIRTFSRDLNIVSNFEVSLDTKTVYAKAIDNLLSQVGIRNDISKTLVNFALQKTDDDKDWNITKDLNKIAGLISNENDQNALEILKSHSLEDFEKLSINLKSKVKSTVEELKSLAQETFALLNKLDIEPSHFSRKTFYNFILSIYTDPLKTTFSEKSKWQNDIENYTFYLKTTPDEFKDKIDGIRDQLISFFYTAKHLYFEAYKHQAFLNNLVPLSTLKIIYKEIQNIKNDENVVLISDFNNLIHTHLKNEPAAFIYERLGEKYTNYFIDEFQDTSVRQWQNLVPLIDNPLATLSTDKTPNSLLIVGDPKQAIYRWRGGRAEQFIALSNNDSPFSIKNVNHINLETNYRSAKEIVAFNNSFFSYIARQLENPIYNKIYLESNNQQSHSKKSGYIQIQFVEDVNNKEAAIIYSQEVLKIIKECVSDGYLKKDICILTRNNNEGSQLAQALSDNDIKVVSSDSLLLQSSKTIQFLINILQLQVQSGSKLIFVEILHFIASSNNIVDTHDYIVKHLEDCENLFESYIQKEMPEFNLDFFQTLSLYNKTEYLIQRFVHTSKIDAYILSFLEVVYNYANSRSESIHDFLQYWEENKNSLSLDILEQADAVQIMSIHKSKGLEFPVVIYPYADSKLLNANKEYLWYPLNPDDYEGFQTLMINYSARIKEMGEMGTYLYNQKREEQLFDSINVLYVALTRAVERMYVVSRFRESDHLKTYNALFINYAKEQGLLAEGNLQVKIGERSKKSNKGQKQSISSHFDIISSSFEKHSNQITNKLGIQWANNQLEAIEKGNILHDVLATIYRESDIKQVINDAVIKGMFSKAQSFEILKTIESIVNHPQLVNLYRGPIQVFNERRIISENAEVFIPDRVVLKDNKVTIIDYKTGVKSNKHLTQVKQYCSLYQQMGYSIDKALLVYINSTVEVVKV